MSGDFLKRMAKINATFLRDPACEPFWKPVDWKELNLPHYPDIIKHPMDLGTIQKRLDEGYYSSAAECAADFRLVWQNCLTFNKGSEYFEELASKLSKKFEERYAKVADAEAAALGPGGGGATPRTQEPAGPRLPSLADKTQFGHGLYLGLGFGRNLLPLLQSLPRLRQCSCRRQRRCRAIGAAAAAAALPILVLPSYSFASPGAAARSFTSVEPRLYWGVAARKMPCWLPAISHPYRVTAAPPPPCIFIAP
eukprot:TRINITY_DN927_c0_g1_i1.p1 TRINITY_DN927_c0_g1~~TRINITY_DN927_c0_g1_i1.p1  ORF type:complete len:252 (-),score=51.29 TRINITY_DN927_c0_g1_i1:131-886(-)